MSSSWDAYKQTMVTAPTLWSAAKENDLPTIAQLCEQGHDLQARDPRGYSPLMLAAYTGNSEAVALLIDRGADVDSVDLSGNSVLMGATFRGHEDIFHQLLAAGANVTAKNHAGLDAHGFAVMFGRTALAAQLQLSVNPHAEPSKGAF